jgi:hypothetical protein
MSEQVNGFRPEHKIPLERDGKQNSELKYCLHTPTKYVIVPDFIIIPQLFIPHCLHLPYQSLFQWISLIIFTWYMKYGNNVTVLKNHGSDINLCCTYIH